MRKISVFLVCCMFLSGCAIRIDDGIPAEIMDQVHKDEATAETVEESAAEVEDDEWKWEIVDYLEQFEDGLTFYDMDSSLADYCGEELMEAYDFIGRETGDGIGYVLGFKKTDSSLLDGLSIYEKDDDHIAAEIWSEQDEEFKTVYEFPMLSDMLEGDFHRGGVNEILYLQPKDWSIPEELQNAFIYRYCYGEESYDYVDDVLERGVRFTPPDTGAYLAVDRYENGNRIWEYVALSEDEEKEILESDEVISPALYGYFGLEFYVGQETYEATDIEKGDITMPALRIAEDRCRFKIREISEIHDIVEAKLEFLAWDEEDEEVCRVMEDISDPEQLMELEHILASSKETGEGKCPYTGVLTLTRKDGEKIVVSLATDSCDGFILESHGVYSPGKEATDRIWDLFPDARKYTGWRRMETEAVPGDTAGPAGDGNVTEKKAAGKDTAAEKKKE